MKELAVNNVDMDSLNNAVVTTVDSTLLPHFVKGGFIISLKIYLVQDL
jgi:hypothetical protein